MSRWDNLWPTLALCAAILLALTVGELQRRTEERLCRHALQRSVGVSHEAAQALIDRQRAEEW